MVRDLDGFIYFRENKGRLLLGGFEPVAKPAFENGVFPGKLSLNFNYFKLFIDICNE